MPISSATPAPQAQTALLPAADDRHASSKEQIPHGPPQGKAASADTPDWCAALNADGFAEGTSASPPPVVDPLPPEGVDLSKARAALRLLVEQMGSEKPIAAAAKQLETTLTTLDQPAEPLLNLLKWTRTDEGCFPHPADAQTPVSRAWQKAFLDKWASISERQLETQLATYTASQQRVLWALSDRLTSPFVVAVVQRSLRSSFSAKAALELGASAADALPPVSIPDCSVVAFEATFAAGLASFAHPIDVDALAQIVMMGCAKDAEGDLRELLAQMQVTNKKRATMRSFIAAQKREKGRMDGELRKQYDRRCSLPKKHPERIDTSVTSFDDYEKSQLLARYGSIGRDQNGMPVDDAKLAISPNETFYPSTPDAFYASNGKPIAQDQVDQADALKITPQHLADLQAYWDANTTALLATKDACGPGRFANFATWLMAPETSGGLGLALHPADDQDAVAERALATTHPGYLEASLKEQWGLSDASATALVSLWGAQDGAYKASYGTFSRWLTEERPFGPGLQKGRAGSVPAADIDAFVAAFGQTRDALSVAQTYGLSAGQGAALSHYYALDSRGIGSLRDFLAEVCGCVPTNTGVENWNAVLAAMRQLSDPRCSAEFQQSGAVTTFNRVAEAQTTWDTLVAADRQANGPYTRSLATPQHKAEYSADRVAFVMAELDHLDPSVGQDYKNKRDPLAELISTYGSYLMSGGGTLADKCDAAFERMNGGLRGCGWVKAADHKSPAIEPAEKNARYELDKLLGSMTDPNERAAAANYIKMKLFLAGQDQGQAERGGDPFMRGQHMWAKEFLLDRGKDGSVWGLEIQSFEAPSAVSLSGMTERPTQDPPEQTLEKLFAAFAPSAATVAATEAAKHIGEQAARTPGPKNDNAPRAEAFIASADFKRGVKELETKHDSSIKQPDQQTISGTELSIASLQAEIDQWQGQYDTLGDMSQEQALKMQTYQERRAKFMETLSNIMKRVSSTAQTITGNMK